MKCLPYLMMTVAAALLGGEEIVVRTPSGEPFVLDIQPNDNFLGTIEVLKSHLGASNEYILDFSTSVDNNRKSSSSTDAIFRQYYAPVTSSEKADIRFIFTTLGHGSLLKIAKESSTLKKTGKRIDHLHPFRFLMCIFTDEEIKAGIHAARTRGWIWGECFAGIRDTLESEANCDNLKQEFINDFAGKVGVNADLISPLLANRQWSQFVDVLLEKIPRSANAGRYEM